ncbi:tetratricopeptide repeat protein [Flavobacterium sp. NST-5]|uniref:histidine kinase n=1 Tax=Flavobacterium ichthyis TaxID=2698827 RepID=A0ABW9Z4V2_9FLAO|nr:tetratricopeptide repeat protein [Flavobacterium ichthyis]NBL63865.1 tetratricopeptide repeat protein [Flavobacterium ichthyis]
MKQCPPIVFLLLFFQISCVQPEREKNIGTSKSDAYTSLYLKIEKQVEEKTIDLSRSFDQLKKMATTSSYQGGYFYLKGKYFEDKNRDSSFIYFEKSVAQYRKANDSLRAGFSLIQLSALQKREADYFGAETALVQAEILMQNQDIAYRVNLYNAMGLLYRELFDYKNAIKYFNKAIDLEPDFTTKNYMTVNVSLVYIDIQKYNDAIVMLDSLLKIVPEDDKSLRSKILSNKGYALYKSGDISGLKFLDEAKSIINPADFHSIISIDLRMAEVLARENLAKAKKLAENALQLSKKIENPDDQLKALELLIASEVVGLQRKNYINDYISINDSIRKVRQQAKNQFAKLRYDYTSAEEAMLKARTEAAENKLRAQKSRIFNVVLFIVIVFALFVFLLLRRIAAAKHANEKIRETYNTEIRLSKKVHDELANDLYNVMAFADLQAIDSDSKNRLLTDLDDLYQRTRNISRVNATVETGEKYSVHLKEMISDFQNNQLNVVLKGFDSISWNALNESKKINFFRVLQELLINTKKHSQATICLISFEEKTGFLEVVFSDNGVGFNFEENIFKNGLQNVENRIRQVRGSIIFEPNYNKGFKVVMKIPF